MRDPTFHQEGFRWSDMRTTRSSHQDNKNALWATHCSCAALRNATATAIVATATIPPDPVKEVNDNTTVEQQ